MRRNCLSDMLWPSQKSHAQGGREARQKGVYDMNDKNEVRCKRTGGGAWVICPVCRVGKVLKLEPDTTARHLTLYCRCCKRESVVDIAPGERAQPGQRVTLAALSAP